MECERLQMTPSDDERHKYHQLALEFLDRLDRTAHQDLILRMLSSVLRQSEDERQPDLKLIASTLEELEHAFDVLEIFSDARKVAVFGSARCPEDSAVYRQARDFAAEIVKRDFMVITGAGPGVMAAGNEGAGRERSFGMNISLPFETHANRFIDGDYKLLNFKYFFTRKLAFVKDSHAAVLCPGGFGTMDEGFEVLTLVQTGKAQLMPIVCLHPEGSGFWDDWHAYNQKTLIGQGFISPDDLHLYKVTTSIQEACDEIAGFYRRFHSMRYYQDALLLRLTSEVGDAELDEINTKFSDIVTKGSIERFSIPDEAPFDKHVKPLPHLRLNYRFGRSGRLRQLVNYLNSHDPTAPILPPERGEGGRLPIETDSGSPESP